MTKLLLNSPAVLAEGRQAQADGKQKDAKEPKKEKPHKAAAEHVLTLQTRKRNNMWGEPHFWIVPIFSMCYGYEYACPLVSWCFFHVHDFFALFSHVPSRISI